MSGKDKWVRRFSVDDTAKHKNGFTIYKITSVLFPLSSPEAVSVVVVWKRYSDVQRLHSAMRALHAGLHLSGTFPVLPRRSYFKRFDKEVIEERAKAVKNLLEFVAEHKLLFASTEFVNFLQSGYPEPAACEGGVINAIRSSLQLPIEDPPPIEYQTSDDDTDRSPRRALKNRNTTLPSTEHTNENTPLTGITIPHIHEPFDVEIRKSPKKQKLTDSFESINSLDSINSDLFEELNKMTIDKPRASKKVLPDLINFDEPSTSKLEDYHTMSTGNTNSETVSLDSTIYDSCDLLSKRSASRVSLYSKKSVLSSSEVQSKTRTEDSYVFEAGYMLNLAARCEDMGDYQRAFECYKSGIEKMLIGVQTDTDPQRRAFIKEKSNKYLSYAEAIYKNHLSQRENTPRPESPLGEQSVSPLPLALEYQQLGEFRFLAVLAHTLMLAIRRRDQRCYVIKVIQKIPNNITEFDDYFTQKTNYTKKPILPTQVPYMVPLKGYIETNDLIFLILSYAPGEKLFDYIKNYVKSAPTTPAREINLENVFAEPKTHRTDIENRNIENSSVKKERSHDEIDAVIARKDVRIDTGNNNDVLDATDDFNKTDGNIDNLEVSVNELVINSQRLLLDVDKVLGDETAAVEERFEDVKDNLQFIDEDNSLSETRNARDVIKLPEITERVRFQGALPLAALRRWSAELLLALEGLHKCGVVCRDLHPDNILLGERGQIILTYFVGYEQTDTLISDKHAQPGEINMYVAPELHWRTFEGLEGGEEKRGDVACDFWSFGAVLYELLCGVPLSYYHRSVFTSHTILHFPDSIDVEARSLLNQLLTYEPSERLGAGKEGIDEIKNHPYFKNIDWQEVYESCIVPD